MLCFPRYGFVVKYGPLLRAVCVFGNPCVHQLPFELLEFPELDKNAMVTGLLLETKKRFRRSKRRDWFLKPSRRTTFDALSKLKSAAKGAGGFLTGLPNYSSSHNGGSLVSGPNLHLLVLYFEAPRMAPRSRSNICLQQRA